jgi:hypothetical protein
MPNYTIVFKNKSDPELPPYWSQTEVCTAPDVETVEQMIRRDAGRFVNVDLFTWTITETAP